MKLLIVSILFSATHCLSQPKEQVSRENQVDHFLSPLIELRAFSGNILVAEGDKILFNKSYGMANYEKNIKNSRDTEFRIASISKGFTDIAFDVLETKHLIDKNDFISKYLPDFPNGNKIQVKHLLEHTSGIRDINSVPEYDSLSQKAYSTREVYEIVKKLPHDFEPGTKTKYSNSGFVVLAYLLEVLTNKTYEAFLLQEIFKPSGMKNTYIDNSHFTKKGSAYGYLANPNTNSMMRSINWDPSIKVGAGCFTSTTTDIYLFLKSYYTGKLAAKPVLPDDLSKAQYFQGNSPGFTSIAKVYLDKNLYVIVLSNNQSRVGWTIGHKIADIFLGKSVDDFNIPDIQLKKDLVARYEGIYPGNLTFEIGKLNNNYALLSIKDKGVYEPWKVSELIPLNDEQNKFLVPLFWETLKFEPDGGKYKAVWEIYK